VELEGSRCGPAQVPTEGNQRRQSVFTVWFAPRARLPVHRQIAPGFKTCQAIEELKVLAISEHPALPVCRLILERDGFGRERQAIQEASLPQDLGGMEQSVSDKMPGALALAGTALDCRHKVEELEGLAEAERPRSCLFRLGQVFRLARTGQPTTGL